VEDLIRTNNEEIIKT